MTGLTESMRANFTLTKDLSQITNVHAGKRMQECRDLLNSFKKNEKCLEEM